MGPSCGLSASWAGRESTLSHLAAGDWNMLRNPHLVIRKHNSRPRAAAQEDSWWETGGKFPSGRFHRSFTLSEMHYLIRYINGTHHLLICTDVNMLGQFILCMTLISAFYCKFNDWFFRLCTFFCTFFVLITVESYYFTFIFMFCLGLLINVYYTSQCIAGSNYQLLFPRWNCLFAAEPTWFPSRIN